MCPLPSPLSGKPASVTLESTHSGVSVSHGRGDDEWQGLIWLPFNIGSPIDCVSYISGIPFQVSGLKDGLEQRLDS